VDGVVPGAGAGTSAVKGTVQYGAAKRAQAQVQAEKHSAAQRRD